MKLCLLMISQACSMIMEGLPYHPLNLSLTPNSTKSFRRLKTSQLCISGRRLRHQRLLQAMKNQRLNCSNKSENRSTAVTEPCTWMKRCPATFVVSRRNTLRKMTLIRTLIKIQLNLRQIEQNRINLQKAL